MDSEKPQTPSYDLLTIGSRLQLGPADFMRLQEATREIKDWDEFTAQAVATHLAPLLLPTVSNEGIVENIPNSVLETFSNLQNQVMVRNIRLQQAFVELGKMLNDQTIPFVPLKGIYLSEVIYKAPQLRHLSDIDILIHEQHLESICDMMAQKGWGVQVNDKRSDVEEAEFASAHPITLIKQGIYIELHTHLYGKGAGVRITNEELWNHIRQTGLLGLDAMQFEPEMHVQYLCLHLHKHLFGHELKMIGFCDIRELLLSYGNTFDWNRLRELCDRYGCSYQVLQVLYLAKKHWGVKVPEEFDFSNIETTELEERFWSFFSGRALQPMEKLENRLNVRVQHLSRLEKGDRLRFLLGHVFPKPDYIRKRYRLEESDWLAPRYAYRFVDLGVKTCVALANKVFSGKAKR